MAVALTCDREEAGGRTQEETIVSVSSYKKGIYSVFITKAEQAQHTASERASSSPWMNHWGVSSGGQAQVNVNCLNCNTKDELCTQLWEKDLFYLNNNYNCLNFHYVYIFIFISSPASTQRCPREESYICPPQHTYVINLLSYVRKGTIGNMLLHIVCACIWITIKSCTFYGVQLYGTIKKQKKQAAKDNKDAGRV